MFTFGLFPKPKISNIMLNGTLSKVRTPRKSVKNPGIISNVPPIILGITLVAPLVIVPRPIDIIDLKLRLISHIPIIMVAIISTIVSPMPNIPPK